MYWPILGGQGQSIWEFHGSISAPGITTKIMNALRGAKSSPRRRPEFPRTPPARRQGFPRSLSGFPAAHTHMHIHIHIHIHMHIRIHMHMHIRIYLPTHPPTNVHICMHAWIQTKLKRPQRHQHEKSRLRCLLAAPHTILRHTNLLMLTHSRTKIKCETTTAPG